MLLSNHNRKKNITGNEAAMRSDFVKNHKNAFHDICMSIVSGDFETAHRLSHAVKSSAGLIYEEPLVEAVKDVEQVLAKKEKPTDVQLIALERELVRVIDGRGEAKTVFAEEVEFLGTGEALAVLDKIAPLLESQNANSLSMIDQLRKVPQSARLCSHIEEFDFRAALESLIDLRDGLRAE